MKTELMEIANRSNIVKRNMIAKQYSDKIRRKENLASRILSAIIGIILGLIFGYCHSLSVSAFDKSEWIDICQISRVVEAEAGNQSDLGKRLVACVILNRLNNEDFPDTITNVLEQENQFATGTLATIDTIRIVMEEYEERTNEEVLYFRTGYFHKFATDLFQEGDHFFSK